VIRQSAGTHAWDYSSLRFCFRLGINGFSTTFLYFEVKKNLRNNQKMVNTQKAPDNRSFLSKPFLLRRRFGATSLLAVFLYASFFSRLALS